MRRFFLLMLLAWLPIQAAAMPWLAFKCDQHDAVTHAAAAGLGHHHPSGANDAAGNDAEGGTISGVHTCCHHFPGAAAGLAQPGAAPIAAGVEPPPPAHAFRFFPEPLKRPPLGALV